MAYSFRIDTVQGVVLFKATGKFSDEEMLNCIENVVADPAFKPEFNHLADLRDVDEFEPRSTEIRTRAYRDHDSVRLNASRIAIVSSSDLVYALSRMYATLMEGASVSVRVFKDIGEARKWLGLPPED
jgi:hypothetical protein